MIANVFIDYIGAILINNARNKKIKKLYLILTISINVGTLFYYKYMGFTLDIINLLLFISTLKNFE